MRKWLCRGRCQRKNIPLLNLEAKGASGFPSINKQFSFLEAVVTFPAVPAGNYGEVLLKVADQLCAELGFAESGPTPGARSVLGVKGVMGGILSPEDEALARRVRGGLARIATACGFTSEGPRSRVVLVALDGAEMALRGELAGGNPEQLLQLMPSLVFLVVLPLVEQDRAVVLSRRTAALIAAARGSADDQ